MVSVKNSHLEDNNIGIAVKDGSSSIIEKSNLLNNSIQVAAYAKNWQYGGGGKVKILNSELSSNQNNFDTSSDPDDKDSDESKELVQNSKIELINSIVKGEIKIKGENFINLKK